MESRVKKCFNELKKLGINVNSSDGYPERGVFWISTEGGFSGKDTTEMHMDYYSNFWGSEKLNKILKKYGLWFEWYNTAWANVWND